MEPSSGANAICRCKKVGPSPTISCQITDEAGIAERFLQATVA